MSAPDGKSPLHRIGEATRRAVLGPEHVERAEAAQTEFDAPFQQMITESAWGRLWSRDTWSRRQRSIVTIALLAAIGHYEEMAMHIRATLRTGASEADISEALLHVAIYAGVPTANTAFRIAKQVLTEMQAGKAE
jgi:4-carboxymuconolactone decarboxylase